jgi:radical SAM protein with 4Fe4S-binding SPASM domain
MRFPNLNTLKDHFLVLNPKWDWIQVEVSSFCNVSCLYCPHTVLKNMWINNHLPLATFRKLLPALTGVKLVYLQGWGEPFLNPDFFEMLKLAKNAGCMVGTSTNGMLLDDKMIKRLVKLGLDVIAFSLAGIDENNDIVRKGTQIKTVINAIKSINREKKKAGARLPAINIAYMLLRSRIKDLPKMPLLFKGLGIDQIVISTLDFIPDKELASESWLPRSAIEFEQLRSLLNRTVEIGKSDGLDIHYNIYNPSGRRAICTENVQKSVYISADGDISPCVFTNLPISGSAHRLDKIYPPYHRLTFGNIETHGLAHIWRQKNYTKFRKSFDSDKLAPPCQKCPKLYMTSR